MKDTTGHATKYASQAKALAALLTLPYSRAVTLEIRHDRRCPAWRTEHEEDCRCTPEYWVKLRQEAQR